MTPTSDQSSFTRAEPAGGEGAGRQRDAIARAIEDADASFGYSIRLVRLVDEECTYSLDFGDNEPAQTFPSHEEALAVVVTRRNDRRADAVLVALEVVSGLRPVTTKTPKVTP